MHITQNLFFPDALSDECDQLWVVVARFRKMAHFIPLPKEGKSASDLAFFVCFIILA